MRSRCHHPFFAFVAGVISFSSPCCLPLLPGYVSYISALPTSALGTKECIGPVLAVILAAAAGTGTVAWGGLLLLLYSMGLGIPLIALALGLNRARGSMAWLRRQGRQVELFGGALLVGVGILFVTGMWGSWFRPLQRLFARYGWPPV